KAWRSRDVAIDKAKGTTQTSYTQLPDYLQKLVAANPGTLTELYTEPVEAFAIVDSENDLSWEWFFQKLSAFVEGDESLVFVSDRHASIYKGLSKRNIRSNFKGRHLEYLVAKAARSFRLQEFYTTFNEIKAMDPACAEYLL
ncbi:unnamed protein product, partial [Brassica oleracea var. botrytis]